MGMITLCILLLLAPMGSAFEGTEGVVSVTQTTKTLVDVVKVSYLPVMVTASNQIAPTENETTPGGVTAAASEESRKMPFFKDGMDAYIVVFLTSWAIFGFWCCYNRITPYLRIYPVRSRREIIRRASRSSGDDSVPFLGSHKTKAPANPPKLKGILKKSETTHGGIPLYKTWKAN